MADYNPVAIYSVDVTDPGWTGSCPAVYDAKLFKPLNDAIAPLILKLFLRINMRQLPSKIIPIVYDSDGEPFISSPWKSSQWRAFIDACSAQANMWNGKFWLTPPQSFNEYNVKKRDGSQFRPNILCKLTVDFETKENPHRTIDVANIELSRLVARDSNTFRSNATLYASSDAVPYVDPMPQPGEPPGQHTIAHEIGHALGLNHIGLLRRLTLCEFALLIEAIGLEDYADLKMQGGGNASVCYGTGQGIGNSGNIMGAGDQFAVENAAPWLWAMRKMRPIVEGPLWRAAVADPGPGVWLQDWQVRGRVHGYEAA